MTFSIVGRCARTGMVGMAISTSSIAVTGRCVWVRGKVGAVATQNITDPALGTRILDLMAAGTPADRAVEQAAAENLHRAYRQISAIDMRGGTGHYTGVRASPVAASKIGRDCVAAGNILANDTVPAAMVRRFEAETGIHLAERLLRSLEAGLEAGGEHGPVHSAGLLVAHEQAWSIVNLRIDWADDGPIAQLRALWHAYQPQMQDYLTRALDPPALDKS
ncbi:MAG TPA: DUF1028 domain-containing protein [Stellaceae bacterium]|nr:DUF1028 domain-containing protein [Stellaceae bacterium]